MTNRFNHCLLALILLFSALLATEIVGQTRAEIVRGIERLNKELEFTKELVRSFSNSQGLQLVLQAEQLRDEAVRAVERNRPVLAANNVKMAFSLLEQAQKITLEGPVKRWRSRVEELLRRADHEVLGRNQKEAERVLTKAKENRDAAERALMSRQYRTALEHYQVAVQWAERALDLVRDSQSNDAVVDAKHRFEVLRDRAEGLIEKSGDTRARRIYEQGVQMFRSAEQALNSGDQQKAKKLYNQSILLLLRAIDLGRGDAQVGQRQVEIALNQLRELIDSTNDTIQGARLPRARRLFERGKTYASEAAAAADQGKNEEALWKIELARNILQRAQRLAGGGASNTLSNRISQEIEKTKAEIADVRSGLGRDVSRDTGILLNMSEFALNKAERAAGNGFDRLALESILVAQRFLTKAQRLGQMGDEAGGQPTRLEIRMRQLDAAIAEAEELLGSERRNWNYRLLQSAKDIRGMAADSKEQGNVMAAEEGIQVAFELVRKSLKNVPRN